MSVYRVRKRVSGWNKRRFWKASALFRDKGRKSVGKGGGQVRCFPCSFVFVADDVGHHTDKRTITAASCHAVPDCMKLVHILAGLSPSSSLVPIDHYLTIRTVFNDVLVCQKVGAVSPFYLYIFRIAHYPAGPGQAVLRAMIGGS